MQKEILDLSNKEIIDIMRNTTINMTLKDWPAAVALVTFCLSGVAIYGIRTYAELINNRGI